MAIKFSPILGTLLVVVATLLLHVSAAQGSRKEVITKNDDWDDIPDLQDPKVLELGKFAVDEHNKEAKTKLEFQNVFGGYTKVIEKIMHYRLAIKVKDGDKTHNYKAEVSDDQEGKSRKLIYFKPCKEYDRVVMCMFD